MSSRSVHLVGSVPFVNTTEVFERVSGALGDKLLRIPDGETGPRRNWIAWLEPAFANNPAFEASDEIFRRHEGAPEWRRYGLKAGLSVTDVTFSNLGYARVAKESYAEFRRLRDAGVIRRGTRFQVDLAPGHSVFRLFVVERLHGLLDEAYNAALEREIDDIAGAIPHEDLAIQIDVASAVFSRLERGEANGYGRTKHEMQATFSTILKQLASRVPLDVELLFHFCYGDSGHRHVVEPTDMADMVTLANRLAEVIDRPIHLVHMPVPRNRADDAYFRPLANLELRSETQVCLGLVHFTDGIDGSLRRSATAKRYLTEFAVATECGLGRRPPETIPALLDIHARVAELA